MRASLTAPEGVRGVIRKRVAHLSDKSATRVSVAAVVGREFDVATFSAADHIPKLAVLEALDEAEAARLIAPSQMRCCAITSRTI